MKSYSIIQILRTFTPEEVKSFTKFLRSPYFGGTNFILKFWEVLKKGYPDFEEKHIKKETVFSKLSRKAV